MNSIIISLFLSGIFFGSGPCMASCGPLVISYIAGTRKNVFKGLAAYGLFSLARISVYLLLSLAIFFLGKMALEKFLGDFFKYVVIIGGGFIVLVGVLMALGKRLELKFCHSLQKGMLEHDRKSIVALGFIIGLLPCAPLLIIFSYIALVSKSWAVSLLYALSFGIGTMLSPLVLLVVIAGLIPRYLIDKSYNRWFNIACGIIIVFLGVQLIMRAF